MNIKIDMECGRCGWLFMEGFMEMPHGRVLKCPFCSGTDLMLRESFLVEAESDFEVVERPVKGQSVSRKVKP